MKERELEDKLKLIDKEIDCQENELANAILAFNSEINKMKIEIEITKRFMAEFHSEFKDSYSRIKESVVQEVNPELI